MVRVAAFQAQPCATYDGRLKQIHETIQKVDRDQVDFVCFPEGFLTGYYVEKELAQKNSLEIQSDTFQNWLSSLSHYKATIIIGFNERSGDHIFDSVAVIEKGILLGIQRKHYLYHNYFSSGTSFSPFWSKEICFGVIICLDAMYFEPSRLLALQGATILFCPMCNKVPLDHPYEKRPSYYSHFIARSFENRCWLVAADWIWPKDKNTICPGHTVIYDPDGQEIARSQEFHEEFLIVDIPPERLFINKGRRIGGSPLLHQELSRVLTGDSIRH